MVSRWACARTRNRVSGSLRSSSSGESASYGRLQGVEVFEERRTGLFQGLHVAGGGEAACGDHLGLEAVREDGFYVVAQHVAGLGGDEFLGFEYVAFRGVLPLQGLQLLGGAVAEHVLEEFVQAASVGHRRVRGPSLVEDGDRRAVFLGLLYAVAVYEGAEDLFGGRAVFAS